MTDGPNSQILISYMTLRRAIGLIGILLPAAVAIAKLVSDGIGLQSSISASYYTGARNILVGALCSIGVFLAAYRGPERRDRRAGAIASICAIGVAMCPVRPDVDATFIQSVIGKFHIVFALGMFSMLAYFSLVLFTATHPNRSMTIKKKERNIVYTACGWTIIASIVAIIAVELLFVNDYSPYFASSVKDWCPVFWLETIAVMSFGVSWLTKGEFILADE